MRWTRWRKLAEGTRWYDDEFDYTGPACYELGTGGPRGGDIQPHYIGETGNERARMAAYAAHGSHLSVTIASHLRGGWTLYYRAVALKSKAAAKRMQDGMLNRFVYDWNRQLNGEDEWD